MSNKSYNVQRKRDSRKHIWALRRKKNRGHPIPCQTNGPLHPNCPKPHGKCKTHKNQVNTSLCASAGFWGVQLQWQWNHKHTHLAKTPCAHCVNRKNGNQSNIQCSLPHTWLHILSYMIVGAGVAKGEACFSVLKDSWSQVRKVSARKRSVEPLTHD